MRAVSRRKADGGFQNAHGFEMFVRRRCLRSDRGDLARIYPSEHGDHGRTLLCDDLRDQREVRAQASLCPRRRVCALRYLRRILRGNARQSGAEYACMGLFGRMASLVRADLPLVYGALVYALYGAFLCSSASPSSRNFFEFTGITSFK